ncbi:glycosyltransferase [Agromyces bauzanensis]
MSSVLICSSPVHGHVAPLLAVARHLVDHGHRVRFLTGSRFRDAVTGTGADFLPLPAEADYDDRDLNAAFPGREGLSGPAGIRFDTEHMFLRPIPAQLAAIDAANAAEPIDAVLTETMFVGAGALVTRAQHPPVIALGIVPLLLSSVDTAPFGLGIPPMGGPLGRVRNALLKAVAEKGVFGSVQQQWQRIVAEATGAEVHEFVMNWPRLADAFVQFTVPSFEYPRRDLPSTVHFVGPVTRTLASTAPLPAWWHELDGTRPVVHVTQGTVANLDWNELVAPTLDGLAGEDVLVVVATGGRPLDSLPPLPANARAAEFLPYEELLPRTDVLVSNGGYGGIHYAMEYSVPIVVAGRTEDKVEVTARVAWSGVGVNLKSNAPKPAAVRAAVRRVLSNGRYRAASAAIGRDIAGSPGLAGLEVVLAGAISSGRRPARAAEPA